MEELQKAIDKANETLRNNHCGFNAEPMLSVPNTASIEIEGGDWKHDHAYADYVMRENGFVCISEKITLETEDDWYGSIHYYRFQK